MQYNLTPRQCQLLQTISTLAARHCYLPTIAELAEELAISRSTAFEHIAELRRKGLLSESPGKARSLKPTRQARKLLKQIKDCPAESQYQAEQAIPLLGRVAAGAPIEAIENPDTLSLPSQFGTGDDIFALEVAGDSMLDEDIRNGDYVICRKADTAKNGELVVALTDNENATLKRIYKEKNKVRLQPANKDYEPIYSDDCRVQAVAIGLLRRF
ncbi:MAG: transcriptional repressor LexA [Sedimentisphaerales bacterium]|nr:transcriptional repressor LexA [Sedimentisphaerales bacterium]